MLAQLLCQAILIGQGYSAADVYVLKPMAQDKTLLIASKDHYSFVADVSEFSTKQSLRLFIHDKKSDYTASVDGALKKSGRGGELILKQVIGYESADQLTLHLGCYTL